MSEIVSAADAVAGIPDGASVMIGDFMEIGSPPRLVDEMMLQGQKNLTVITNDTASPGVGVSKLIEADRVVKVITSHISTNSIMQKLMIGGTVDVDLVPRGTLVERIRAAGYGLGDVLTSTGVGTLAAEGRRTIELDGKTYLIALPLKADFALVRAKTSDYRGNLTYSLTARNFNPVMAMAAETVIAEAKSIVPTGSLAPDVIVTPHVVVDYLFAKELNRE
ncbi:3-oxoacid CoA-transferase subunit A [Breoghania sp.]|uniref:3-oxoacid CoA-transferase subunit A n=1 Tax=Breoghania sp. TaxID=2065378 RepID=UPI002606AFBC|nr:3-oxoacid CoA-transferase subunit A [Breoghania sp.]MDJ0933026.1 3-oxoacid CoA-transferase subunit A [Breoghania sp.]